MTRTSRQTRRQSKRRFISSLARLTSTPSSESTLSMRGSVRRSRQKSKSVRSSSNGRTEPSRR